MMISLSAKNKLGFVDRSVSKPDRDSPSFSRWQRCNDMVIFWLLHAMTKDLDDSFLLSGDAYQIWSDLELRFSQSNGAHVYSVEKELSAISQGSDNIVSFFTRIKRVWDEKDSLKRFPACSCSLASVVFQYDEEQRLMQFLMGLNEAYYVVRGSILMMSPLPSIHQAYSLLIQEEKQREIQVASRLLLESSSLNTSSQRQASKNKRHVYTCNFCKKTGHIVDRCYKLHGMPGESGKGQGHPVVAQTFSDANHASTPTDEQSIIPGLTSAQYGQLLQLLQTSASSAQDSPSALSSFAGPFSEEASGSW